MGFESKFEQVSKFNLKYFNYEFRKINQYLCQDLKDEKLAFFKSENSNVQKIRFDLKNKIKTIQN